MNTDLDVYANPDDSLTFDGQDVNAAMPDSLTQDALRAELGLEWQVLDLAAHDEVTQFYSDMNKQHPRKG